METTRDPWPRWLLLSLLFAALPFAVVLVRFSDNFYADDSYFYFQVAWNLAHGLGSTFNGLIPTNGYHPLWMLVCAAVEWFTPTKIAAVHAIAVVISLLNIATVVSVTALLRRAGVALPMLAWLLLLPWLFVSQLGTEGALSACLLAATLLVAYRFARQPSSILAATFSLAAGLLVLSRLDNIFVVTALTAGLLLCAPRGLRAAVLRMLLAVSPIALVLWTAYLWSNHHFFGTWQPISGVLKSHNHHDHRLGSNLPHIALFDLLVLAVGLPVLAWRRRDLFFHVIELPLAAGVLVHALYIVFRMSNETRWSWYYVTWTVLASLVLARVGSALLARPVRLQWPVLAGCLVVLLALAAYDFKLHGHDDPSARDPGFQEHAVEDAHLSTLLAFDKPGRIAYYSTARIIPLDGLMGDLQFQKDLQADGIVALERRYRVDGFIGPPQHPAGSARPEFCDTTQLSSVRFTCTVEADGNYRTTSAEVLARLTGASAGIVPLPTSNLVWNAPGYVAVWRVRP